MRPPAVLLPRSASCRQVLRENRLAAPKTKLSYPNYPALEQRYAEADADRDGYLCWPELEAFQKRLDREFEYQANPTALRPDQFLAQGGGDCEDWALMSCGLFRYWGWPCYVGRLAPGRQSAGHAVCLVRSERKPAGYMYYTVTEACTGDGRRVPPGDYVPIDYGVVGGLTNAVGNDWRLQHFYEPERMYGLAY